MMAGGAINPYEIAPGFDQQQPLQFSGPPVLGQSDLLFSEEKNKRCAAFRTGGGGGRGLTPPQHLDVRPHGAERGHWLPVGLRARRGVGDCGGGAGRGLGEWEAAAHGGAQLAGQARRGHGQRVRGAGAHVRPHEWAGGEQPPRSEPDCGGRAATVWQAVGWRTADAFTTTWPVRGSHKAAEADIDRLQAACTYATVNIIGWLSSLSLLG